ncbi:MAG: hypothetical protein ACKVP0_10195 [Pirellulaceae bacterium]
MHRYAIFMWGIVVASLTVSGCTDSSTSGPLAASPAKYQLNAEPAGALEVLDAKDQAKDGEPIVVVGRLGGGVEPWIDGRAAFLLVDTRILPSCQEEDQCKADCPDCAKEMLAASTMVKFLGDDGKVLPVDARTLLGVKEQETVVIEGVASRDKSGNVSISAKGIYVRR